jgi:hypothetical protein
MAEILEGWQCIGCGKLGVERPCIGICQDKRVALVLAGDFRLLESRNKLLESIVRRMARRSGLQKVTRRGAVELG